MHILGSVPLADTNRYFLKVALLKMIVALIAERRSISTKNYRIPTIFAATWRRKREEV